MKLPQRRIQWVCLAIAGYFLWGVFYVLFEEGFHRPKALAGAVCGCIAFMLIGLARPRDENVGPDAVRKVEVPADRK